MLLFAKGSTTDSLSREDVRAGLFQALEMLGERRRVLAIPPDFTRYHSQAGMLSQLLWDYYRERLVDVLPAIGTHYTMTDEEIEKMFASIPRSLFRVHDWRSGLVTLGEVPSQFVCDVSEGKVEYTIPIQVDKLLVEGRHDLILSIGQVVPHEVIGMANYNKNILIGTGGSEAINKTHFLGAAYGMERIMGRVNTPVRMVLNYGSERFAKHLPIVYVQTVI
ncbi:MAG: D-mannonate epimerase, partial [Acidobacteria bacterium]|nr:D-mannonate epimerase [Acidobacteriota bacterium]